MIERRGGGVKEWEEGREGGEERKREGYTQVYT